jgi:hypothetical protein
VPDDTQALTAGDVEREIFQGLDMHVRIDRAAEHALDDVFLETGPLMLPDVKRQRNPVHRDSRHGRS